MSKSDMSRQSGTLQDVRVDVVRNNGSSGAKGPRNTEFVYVNSAYVGSVSDINENRISEAPITEVYREQYWACSKWPYTQRILALAVGVLLGALIGLVISFALKNDGDSVIGGIFTYSVPN